MKAAVCYEYGKPLVIDDLDLAPPQAGEVKVKIAACAICHSDITYADGGWGGTPPQVFGHEASGVVAETGPGVHTVKAGDRVLVTLLRSCGHCGSCENGRLNVCETRFPLDREARMHNGEGTRIKQGLRTGAFAEYTVVDQSQVAIIPADLPFDVASLLSCGVITGFGAVVNTARLPANAGTGVIGCGGVGLFSPCVLWHAFCGVCSLKFPAQKSDTAPATTTPLSASITPPRFDSAICYHPYCYLYYAPFHAPRTPPTPHPYQHP